MIRAGKLVGEAVVIVQFNPHADGTTQMAWMKELSEDNGADVDWFD